MVEYVFSKHMKHILKLLDRFFNKPIYKMSQEEIDRLSSATIPNNLITRKLMDKRADHIEKKTLRVPTADDSIYAYLFTKKEHSNQDDHEIKFDRPLILFLHGGGWIIGHTIVNDFLCSRLVAITNAVVLSVDYRLAPEYRFPAAVNDTYSALVWAASHATAWGASEKNLFVMGESAGGNLSAVMGLKALEEHGPEIAGQILLYPVTDGRMNTESYRIHANAPQLDRRTMEFFFENYKRSNKDIYNPYFSPILAEEHTGLPPALIVTAEYDPLHDEGILYGKCLEHAGVSVEYLDCKQTIHGFINYPKATGIGETEEAISRFIERHINF